MSVDMEESQKDFYASLGLLSTKFAKMEYNLMQILGLLVVDDFVVTCTIFDKNSLAQNIELLKRINKYRKYEEEYLQNLIRKISNVKQVRNSFIHGVWSKPYRLNNDIVIICREQKIQYNEEKEKGGVVSRSWSSSKSQEYRLSYIKRVIRNLDEIIGCQDYFIEKLKDSGFE